MTNELKNATISAAILYRMQSKGLTIREAIDDVCGKGTSERVLGEVYDALRGK